MYGSSRVGSKIRNGQSKGPRNAKSSKSRFWCGRAPGLVELVSVPVQDTKRRLLRKTSIGDFRFGAPGTSRSSPVARQAG